MLIIYLNVIYYTIFTEQYTVNLMLVLQYLEYNFSYLFYSLTNLQSISKSQFQPSAVYFAVVLVISPSPLLQ